MSGKKADGNAKGAGADAQVQEAAAAADSPKAAAGEAAPAWQSPDYSGPMDIEQANWRRANIKPAGGARTK